MESNDKIENIKVEVSVEFIKSVRNLIEVCNDRIKWIPQKWTQRSR